MSRTVNRERGLYKNGTRWWVRSVRSPNTGETSPRSTGTDDLRLANRVLRMLADLKENRTQWEWLHLAATGEVPLDLLFTHHSAGTLHLLREQREERERAQNDMPLEPFVNDWSKHLESVDIQPTTRAEYVREVRFLVKEFTQATFTGDAVKSRLHSLEVSNSTKRRFVAALKLFCRWGKKRIPLHVDPFEDADWIPRNNPPRSMFWDHDRVQVVLSHMEGIEKTAMATIFGSGIELGALLDQLGSHVNWRSDERTMVAPGSKNDHRVDRTVFVDQWAWSELVDHARLVLPKARLWPWEQGKTLREAFYQAQVAAGIVDSPPVNKRTGKKLWGQVPIHTVHDARHSFVINRTLGLDGGPRQDASYCARQLGHADETMVMKVYGKANVKERLRLIELREAREGARRAANG